MEKLCPMMTRIIDARATHHPEIHPMPCMKDQCEWWTDSWTMEGLPIRGCAIRINALKMKDGRVIV